MNPKEQILSSLPEDKRKEAENILKLLDSKDLTMLEELQTMNETLKEIKDKPDVEMPEMPEEVSIKNFPDIQDVNVINFPESKAPIVNVAPPKVEVNVPDVIVPEIKIPDINIPEIKVPEINTDKLDESIKELATSLEKPTTKNPLPVVLVYNEEKYRAMGGGGASFANLTGDATEATLVKLVGEYTLLLDDVTTTSVTYVGKAAIGSATSSAVWQIKKIDESGTPTTLTVKWAGGASDFDQVWDNRASLSYS